MTSDDDNTKDDMLPITYDTHPVAMAGRHQFWLTQSVELLPDGHPLKRMTVFMCAFARDVLMGEVPGPYSDDRAARFAREVMLPPREFIAMSHEEDIDLALHFQVPLREVGVRRAELDAAS